ncbi:response regulator [Streptomyces gardneri]|uniref:response regulator transcription factor n=1 Tax=Nocardia TaxID=1817 RepID=UPI00135947FA|nr:MULTISPECIES: response regulator [Nocardia]MBF6166108.1 response regulator [Streptomyces gardneri]MBF6207069.1 response regulator [Streptomyces gardneri]UAK31810.1 response regulator [Nocardia asteroides]
MATTALTALVVDDDFRVANLHAGIVESIAGFTVAGTANTLAAARTLIAAQPVDLALVDIYLPDGSGIDFVREIRCDAMILTASTESDAVRAAITAGALAYLIKPFPHTELAARLAAYARYRRILAAPQIDNTRVSAALHALRPTATTTAPATAAPSPTKDLVLRSIHEAGAPLSAGEVATAIGVSRATAQRYLAALVSSGAVRMRLRYGSTGRPEQEYSAATPH